MLGISFKALDVSRERRAAIAAARAIRIEDATKDAQQHVREDADEWDMVDVEDQDAVASVSVDLENGNTMNLVAGSAVVDVKQVAEENFNKIKIEETEAERIALAAGDDIEDDQMSHHIMVQKRGSNVEDDPSAYKHHHQIGATDRPNSNRNSLNSSINVGENDSRGLSDSGEDARLRTVENSPLGAEMLARLKFLDEMNSDEEGGVKL